MHHVKDYWSSIFPPTVLNKACQVIILRTMENGGSGFGKGLKSPKTEVLGPRNIPVFKAFHY